MLCSDIDSAIRKIDMSLSFFVSGTEITLDFDSDLNSIDPIVVYGYFLSRIIFAPEHILAITSAESDGGEINIDDLKQFLGNSRDLKELVKAWPEDLIETEIFHQLPAEWAVIYARLPARFGKSSFVRFSCGGGGSDLSIVAYCLNGSVEEFGEAMRQLFSAEALDIRGGTKSGCQPIRTDEAIIEEMNLAIDPETHLHPDDIVYLVRPS